MTIYSSGPEPGPSDPGDEPSYGAWNAGRKLPLLRVALALAATIVLLLGFADRDFPRSLAGGAGSVRVLTFAGVVALFGLTFWRPTMARTGIIVLASLVVGSLASCYLSVRFGTEPAFRIVATHFAFAVFAISVSPTFGLLLAADALLFVVPNVATAGLTDQSGLGFEAEVVLGLGLVAFAVLGYYSQREQRDLYMTGLELGRAAATDDLTGIANRRHVLHLAERELARARRFDNPLCCLVLDIDRFKHINDKHGHQAGDIVLREMSQAVAAQVRKIDAFGRLGGEEFVIFLPETTAEAGFVFAERLRRFVSELAIEVDHAKVRFTVSIGMSSVVGKDDTVEDLLKRADMALYEAKNAGRNQVAAA